jgi:hypothetical protein
MNLSQKAVSLLAALRYEPSAAWGVNVIPFGSVFWLDEMPSMAELFESPGDTSLIHSMFGLRLKIWDGHALNVEDQQLWDSVRAQVPDWPFFRRLHLSSEQKQAREQAELQVLQAFDSLSESQ